VLASHGVLGMPTKPSALLWTLIGSTWWALTLPPTVHWARRVPLRPGAGLGRQLAYHLPRAIFLSLVSGMAIWASKWVGTQVFGTEPYSLRQLFSNLFASWMLFDLFMYAVALCAVSVLVFQSELRDRELAAAQLETQLAQTEIRLLKAQLDPHFVFNALHAISSLVHRDPAAADRMVCRLSDFLRLSLASTGAPEVTLQQELEHLRSYMEVQMVRFRGRLTLDVDVPTELLSAMVPTLLLQPLVENVVKHGVAVALRPVHARVSAAAAGGELRIEIADDGPGLPPEAQRREGIGLTNTRARLRRLYGETHRLTLADRPERGTAVTVALPLRRDEAAAAAAEAIQEVAHAAGLHR